MVCDQCARKQSDLVTVDNRNKRIFGNLKVESSKKYSNGKNNINVCLKCKGRAEGRNEYCLTCAYKTGICEMCGKKLMKTNMYKYNDINNKDEKRKKKMMERSRLIAEEIRKEKKLIRKDEKKEGTKIKSDKEKVVVEIERERRDQSEDKKDIENNKIKKKEFVPLFEDDKKDDLLNEEYDEIINL